jgi:fatty-acyl-CoA synthase
VLDVAVVGAPDERWGETVVAVLACEPATEPTVEQVGRFAAGQLARYKIPTQVLRTDTLPRSPSGKLDKLTIRAWAHDQLRR